MLPRFVRAESAQDIASVPSLGDLAARRGIAFGAAVGDGVFEDPRQADLYRHHARILTTDTALKFWTIRPAPDVANFASADRLVDFAHGAAIPIRGHNLIWNEWNPPWVAASTRRERAYWLDRHIDETVGRYAGRMHSWDVVNEPLWPDHGNPGGLRGGPWYDAMGKDYVRRSFARAARADPKAKLVLNEAGPEWTVAFRPTATLKLQLLHLVDRLKDADVRLDAVGLECHWFPDFHFDASDFSSFLSDLAAREVEIYLTEIDVNDARFPDTVTERDERVAGRYAELLAAAVEQPAVKAIITWELADRQSWLNGAHEVSSAARREPRPLPFDENYNPKPAYRAIAAALAS